LGRVRKYNNETPKAIRIITNKNIDDSFGVKSLKCAKYLYWPYGIIIINSGTIAKRVNILAQGSRFFNPMPQVIKTIPYKISRGRLNNSLSPTP
jgi:hypothetical protein